MKRVLILLTFVLSIISANGIYLSPIPLPLTKIINLNISHCDEECLASYLKNEEYLSFLANLKSKYIQTFHNKAKSLSMTLNVQMPFLIKTYKIVILSKKPMDRFSNMTMKTLLSLLLEKESKNFLIENRFINQNESYQEAIDKIKDSSLIILLAHFNEISHLNIHTSTPLFIPTINKNTLPFSIGNNIYFGGIDYLSQIEKLLHISKKNITLFFLSSSVLSQYLKQKTFEINLNKDIKTYDVSKTGSSLKSILKKNHRINSSSVVLYTPPITTALILSQLTYLGFEPINKLSLQMNYTPKLLEITQPIDRKNLIIANSIDKTPIKLKLFNELIENDIEYSWVNYATLLGSSLILFPNNHQLPLLFSNNQILYNIKLIEAKRFRFKPLEKSPENSLEF